MSFSSERLLLLFVCFVCFVFQSFALQPFGCARNGSRLGGEPSIPIPGSQRASDRSLRSMKASISATSALSPACSARRARASASGVPDMYSVR